MSTSPLTLDQLGVPAPLRDRAKMLWIITLVLGLWGWVICKFFWKVDGQEESDWYKWQLKQALWAGILGWVGYAVCGFGYFVHAIMGLLGFLAVNKGEDFDAPVVGKIIREQLPDFGAGGMISAANSRYDGTGAAPVTPSIASGPVAPQQPPRQRAVAPTPAPQPEPEPEPEEDLNEEGWRRDYAMEARDDAASFDLRRDLGGWYRAQKQIEAAWEDRTARLDILRRYGIRDEPHFYQVQATVERFVSSAEAARIYGGPNQIMQLQMNAVMDDMRAQQQQRAAAMSAELEPVEGITLQHWAWGQASLAQGVSVDQILGHLQIDRARWDRASAEWNARMSRDATATIATEYGKYFVGAGQGQYGASGQEAAGGMTTPGARMADQEPYPFERWVEISVALEIGSQRGWDPAQVLAHFGMNAADWGTSSGWWSMKFQQNAYDQGFLARYNQLQDYYKAHWSRAGQSSSQETDF